ncbi:hypothetical protein GCM10010174_70100 [Kutzneria viridogrisea]|uniref:Uncharacterized protein n=1 Tax=Kutzneria viridogrisea TaxID=47990 RepID=A0ABR6BAY4_9PSEU|nr:hypothetical protein [Kutzneria viridogrisea]
MARDVPTPQAFVIDGVAPTYSAVSGNNDQVANNGRRLVHVKNGGGSSLTVTVGIGGAINGHSPTGVAVSIAAGADKFIGPFPASYNQADGTVYLDYSATASVTRAVLELPVV